MAIRLWPQDFEKKEHINKAEKALLRDAKKHFGEGHFAVNIDPLGMSTDKVQIPIWNYVTLAECKSIILNGSNWSVLFEDIFVRPEEQNATGGKDKKTDWILRLNSIANKLDKETYSVPIDEYNYVKSVYDWVMSILVC